MTQLVPIADHLADGQWVYITQAARMHCRGEAERLTGAVGCQAGVVALGNATRVVHIIRGCRDDAHLAIKRVSRASEVALQSKAWSDYAHIGPLAVLDTAMQC